MSVLRSLFYTLIGLPVKLWVKCKVIPEEVAEIKADQNKQPIFYIVRHQSASDLIALQKACRQQGLPDPLEDVEIQGKSIPRSFCIDKLAPVFNFSKQGKTEALAQGEELLKLHNLDDKLDAQLIPANLNWGRTPTIEKNNTNLGTVIADQESPSWLRKLFIVIFLGRHAMVRFSKAFSLRNMVENHGNDEKTARKMLRVARFHFYRQTVAATGPRLMHRQQMFTALLANPSVKRVLNDEMQSKNISKSEAKKQALKIMDEIAGDYRDSMVRFGERILSWLWNRLYNGIEVKNANRLRELAEDGHEIIYVPCHRSHMDYLLLTYVIYHQGLVTPRIAAGINLNFWPAGPIFRKSGAFFIRRSFRGNRLYSTIFREYLGLLFERGYSVKYYTEGGRSRTGRLLTPKTGMLAMTIQSLLRGIDRPLTLVPVYLGYEHVMEVGTYHKELSGRKKKNESIFGVLKAIKNLRNYGKGFVNFGEPININQFLNEEVPDWKDAIDPIDPQKPSWLTPSVNALGNQVMTAINKSAALNGTALIALILHASTNKALSKTALNKALDFFLTMQKKAPYSSELTLPEESAEQLIEEVIKLGKVTVSEDSLGSVLSLCDSAALETGYYRNNILHTFLLPALICRLLDNTTKLNEEELISICHKLIDIIKPEFFLWQSSEDITEQVKSSLAALEELGMAKHTKAGFWSLIDDTDKLANVRLLSECGEETVQRLVLVSQIIHQSGGINKRDLEEKMVAVAERLSKLNNINAPEFTDKKAQSSLINQLKALDIINTDEDGKFQSNDELVALKNVVSNLVDIKVLQTISQ